ncbi:hypothetical protein HYN56_19465 [Flavobacterium crocinum]|uniref:Uncharacterized protein n=1 Tax=Flavobacterium crocinum TaxID=2183896 RepID=A0A2S1YQ92_9FLAO|nr:hypothetical protein HYN56_19465 [Flavobacterium crocinum]
MKTAPLAPIEAEILFVAGFATKRLQRIAGNCSSKFKSQFLKFKIPFYNLLNTIFLSRPLYALDALRCVSTEKLNYTIIYMYKKQTRQILQTVGMFIIIHIIQMDFIF